jgi:hypothetical protein
MTAGPPQNHLRDLFHLNPSRRDHIPAFRIAVGVAVPLLILLVTDRLDLAIYAAFRAGRDDRGELGAGSGRFHLLHLRDRRGGVDAARRTGVGGSGGECGLGGVLRAAGSLRPPAG